MTPEALDLLRTIDQDLSVIAAALVVLVAVQVWRLKIGRP
jgi:hypothetical protein